MEAPAPISERILRECDCPPWVYRCAHFDGRGVFLNNPRDNTSGHQTTCWLHGGETEYVVAPTEAITRCNLCGHEQAGVYEDDTLWAGGDHAAALAAFYEAEERLLHGEDHA